MESIQAVIACMIAFPDAERAAPCKPVQATHRRRPSGGVGGGLATASMVGSGVGSAVDSQGPSPPSSPFSDDSHIEVGTAFIERGLFSVI